MEAASVSVQPRGGCGWEGKPREAEELGRGSREGREGVSRLQMAELREGTGAQGGDEEEQGSFSQTDPLWDVTVPPQRSRF